MVLNSTLSNELSNYLPNNTPSKNKSLRGQKSYLYIFTYLVIYSSPLVLYNLYIWVLLSYYYLFYFYLFLGKIIHEFYQF